MKNLLYYQIEKIFVKKPIIKIFLLFFISIISLLIGSLFYYYFVDTNFTTSLWNSWTFIVDAGSHVAETKFAGKFISIIITVLGMLFFATLVGLLTSGIEETLEELRKGRSSVVEKNHIVILGWSDKIFSIINQISKANENENKIVIVILAEKEKDVMDLELANNTQLFRNTEVITRTGELFGLEALSKVSLNEAKNLILLDEDKEFSDNIKIRILLTIKKYYPINIPIIIELRNEVTLEIIKKFSAKNIYQINMNKTVNRLIAQSVANPGVGIIYSKILDFNGPSFYIIDVPQLIGQNYSNLLFKNDEICLCGISSEEKINFCPNSDYKIKPHDKLVVLSDGKQNIRSINNGNVKDYKILKYNGNLFQLERDKQILIIGNHTFLNELINEIYEYFDSTVKITIISSSNPYFENNESTKLINDTFENYMNNSGMDLNIFDNIIVFSNSEKDDKFTNDSEVLVNYIYIKNHLNGQNKFIHIVAEIFDESTEKILTEETNRDFIISEDLISNYISTIAFNNEIYYAWEDLFSYGGNLIQVNNIADIFQNITSFSFNDISKNMYENNALLIGYIDKRNIIHINPNKKSIERQWSESEKLIYIIKRAHVVN